jgi:superfamily II DNA/RNA helicase
LCPRGPRRPSQRLSSVIAGGREPPIEGVAPSSGPQAPSLPASGIAVSGRRSEQTRSVPLSVLAASATIPSTTNPTDPDPDGDQVTFADLGVRAETVEALRESGIVHPFPIQSLTLPLALRGTDIIGQARTGTGKTLAFGIPVVQTVRGVGEGADGRPQALVVVPTRELCVQVTEDIQRAAAPRALRVVAVYGGRAYEPQLATLRAGAEIVVGTPGRLLDLANQRILDLAGVGALVLDEADEMLDLGFLPDVERIISLLPEDRQTMLFSATMPGPVIALARRFMRRPVHITAEQPDEGRTVPSTHQHVLRAHALDKMEVLARVLQAEGRGLAMVFVRTRRTADRVAEDLGGRHFAAAAVHGDLGQSQREQALRAFRSGKVDVLVATDVAARGIDVGGLTHVVNYQCPEDEKVYLHRIGRTGRAGGSGVAVTFVDWDDTPRWQLVNRALQLPFDLPLETYSTSPHLYEMFGIPTDAGGTLPVNARTRAGLAAEHIEDLGEGRRERGRMRRGRAGRKTEANSLGADAAVSSTDGGPTTSRRVTRTRRRTRGGGAAAAAAIGLVELSPVADAAAAAIAAESSADVTESTGGGTGGTGGNRTTAMVAATLLKADADGTPTGASASAVGDGDGADAPPRRRRRRRGGRNRTRANATAAPAAPDMPDDRDDDADGLADVI